MSVVDQQLCSAPTDLPRITELDVSQSAATEGGLKDLQSQTEGTQDDEEDDTENELRDLTKIEAFSLWL